MPRVYIIILNYKNWEDVVECLESLLRSRYENYSVIVIDNDSQNNSLEHLMQWTETDSTFTNRLSHFSIDIQKPVNYRYFTDEAISMDMMPTDFPALCFVQNQTNKGFAGGMNRILKILSNEDAYIWLLNPDMVVEETTLPALVEFSLASPPKSIIGSVIRYHDQPNHIHLYAGGKINFNSATIEMATDKKDINQLDYISGGSLFTYAGNYKTLGLLPEEYFLYWEETDWCYRAKSKGYQLMLCETATCYDKVSTAIGKSFLADFYYTRNGLIFLSKYKRQKLRIALFFTVFRFLKRIMIGQPMRAKGVYRGMQAFLKSEA